jgi:UDP-N-acetylglucosamine 2-epimerase (non-hydrolysing)
MIHIIVGTKAQLIKMAPIMSTLQKRGMYYNYIFTGQHKETVDDLRANFGIKEPDVVLYKGPEITNIFQMVTWGFKIIFKVLSNKKNIFKNDKDGIVLNHGDTFSTLLGTLLAKVAGLKSGHVESGLRSYNYFHPFPEEIIRVLVFFMTDYYFCPGDWALGNLKRYKGKKINTHLNTLYDSLIIAKDKNNNNLDIPGEKFAVASIHRYENIFRLSKLKEVIAIIEDIAKDIKILFIMHPPTKKQLLKHGLFHRLDNNKNIELRPRYDYFSFIELVINSEFLISDGGSNQEEAFFLGKPCLLLRKKTERQEGLKANVVLSGYDKSVIKNFVYNYHKYKKPTIVADVGPSDIIVDNIKRFV